MFVFTPELMKTYRDERVRRAKRARLQEEARRARVQADR